MSFGDWKGRIKATFQAPLNGQFATITGLVAPNPKVCTIYYNHPIFNSPQVSMTVNGKSVPVTKPVSMSVAANPVEVFEFLQVFEKVVMPISLQDKIECKGSDGNKLRDAVDMILKAEHKISIEPPKQEEIPGQIYGRTLVGQRISLGQVKASLKDPEKNRDHVMHLIEPWVFVKYYDEESRKRNAVLASETVLGMIPLTDPALFGTMDHEAFFKELLKVKDSTLAGIWLTQPDYFNVLKIYDAAKFEVLADKAMKGFVDGSR